VKTVKGIELPINILVIIAVAVIVLLGVIALYFSGFMGPAGIVTQDAAKSAACKIVMSNVAGCEQADPTAIILGELGTSPFDGNKDGHACYTGSTDTACIGAAALPEDTLQDLCKNYFGVTTSAPPTGAQKASCRQICGCTG
jgi:hypothetical protein